MFSPVLMVRLSVVVLERDERAVLRDLGQLGAVQLLRTAAGPDTAPLAPRDRARELARCDRLSAGVDEVRQMLGIVSRTGEATIPNAMTLDQATEHLQSMRERADELLQRRQRLVQEQKRLTAVCEQVANYRGLDLPLDERTSSSFLHFVTGSLPARNLESLLHQAGPHVALLPLREQEGRQSVIVMTLRRNRSPLEDALRQAGFQPQPLPSVAGETVDTLFDKHGRDQTVLATSLQQVDEQLKVLVTEVAGSLADIEQLADNERSLLVAEQHFPRTEAAVLITGWVPADVVPELKRHLEKAAAGRCVVETAEPQDVAEEQIPVLLRHPRLLRPFQMLVAAYGLPKYRELEPTLFVAVSYVLMFGMMFGDAGHGAVLAAGGLAALLGGRTGNVRDGGLLLLCGGLSSVIFGVIYGSYFGLPGFKHYALWHDPLEGDPMTLMYAAIGLGIVMISLGLVLNIINHLRRGDWMGGLLDKFGIMGALFYWGVLALVAKSAAVQASGLMNVAILFVLVLPIVGWTLKEPLEYLHRRRAGHAVEPGAGLVAALTESLVGAFEAILSYLANTISFVRLAAYAMSHAALLVAAFMMAAEVERLATGGTALGVLVIVLGNVVAIALEGIVASVQALRLEYYEFFGKFFSGDGQAFKPFRLAATAPGAVG